MTERIRLIVALGNPGAGHAKDRHNAGFWLADELARDWRANFRLEKRYKCELAQLNLAGGEKLWLQKPMTYMNKSGEAVQPLSAFYKIPAAEILVIHDEMDLPAGTIRFKQSGGHGGHNGLRDIHRVIGKDYKRLRVGIGHPGHRDGVLNHVLSAPSKQDQAAIDLAMADGIAALNTYLRDGWDRAVQQLHNRKK